MMKMVLPVTILCLLLGVRGGDAQEVAASSLRPGDRIRLSLRQGGKHVGLFDALSGETLTWRPLGEGDAVEAAEPESRPTQSFYRLEKSLGERPVGWNGFLITVAAGGAVGGILGGTLWKEDWLFDSGDLALVGAMLGMAAGIPVGILVSRLVKVEKWAPVDVRGSGPTLELRPLPGGRFGLGLSLPIGR